MALYLEPTDAATGALRLIPGSHLEPLHSTLQAGRSSVTVSDSRPADEMTALLSEDDGTRVPQYVCATQPGDVVAFDVYGAQTRFLGLRALGSAVPWPWLHVPCIIMSTL